MQTRRSIIVRTPNWVGDAVMALPFLASLRLNAQSSEIAVLTRPHLREFFEQVSVCDLVISLTEAAGRRSLRAMWRDAMLLRARQFDLAICLPPSFGSALMMRLAGIPERIGHAADSRGFLLTRSLPYLPNGRRPHRATGFLDLLNLAFPNARVDSSLLYDPGHSARAHVDAMFRKQGIPDAGSILALSPGAGQPNKLWRLEKFAEVGRRWLSARSGYVIVVGGDADRAIAEQLYRGIGTSSVANLSAAGSLPVTAEIIRRANAFVGNDSGLSHVAAAVRTPVVVISGPGDPREVAPFTDDAITVKKSLFCSPCYSNSCFRKDHPLECQDLVSVAEVWDALNTLLNRRAEGNAGSET